MSALNPRGPLPARVYWVRRALVVAVPVLLVALLGSFLSRGSDGSDRARPSAGETAVVAGAEVSQSATGTVSPRAGPTAPAKADRARKKRARRLLAAPDGPCAASDVVVEPEVGTAEAGRDVRIALMVSSTGRPACTWTMSPDTMTVRITSGSDGIWSSEHCPDVVPTEDLVVREEKATRVVMVWDARRSDEGCTEQRTWEVPGPGYYHVQAAALAGEPSDVQFRLRLPTRPTVTASPTPEPEKRKRRQGRAGDQESAPTSEPQRDGEPSGATEPNG